MIRLQQLHEENEFLLLKCISGSRAYGLQTPQSDTDYKGIFISPKREYFNLSHQEQINNETNDIVYYEWKKVVELLGKNNPTILELLATQGDCVLYKHPLLEQLKVSDFLSKMCCQTFAGYAQSQVKKARGLKKKISNPMEPERKEIVDFCYVISGLSVSPLRKWLFDNQLKQTDCGLVKLTHMRDMYALFHQSQSPDLSLKGIFSGTDSNDVSVSSIPKGIEPLTLMSFNKDAYSIHCREYAQYWEWIEKRNESRYQSTVSHGKNYDAKNMMHTFRLLNMAEEIAREGVLHVKRPDRDFLMSIREGRFEYEELLKQAEDQVLKIEELFEKSTLPQEPDLEKLEELLFQVRDRYYLL
ncbi:nucleotidyltransferase domain-containing protein [Fluviicola sp.]|uniref:nucleotidyltransferase domain-containing protein n=1 Tax=Fluviicola sp. TaxID=1917219 RepID=UPI002633FB49|nr:nucleotidyltransferase domain-containing protein [Fluviicola sp.]